MCTTEQDVRAVDTNVASHSSKAASTSTSYEAVTKRSNDAIRLRCEQVGLLRVVCTCVFDMTCVF